MAQSLSFDQVADEYDETRGGLERGRQVAADTAPRLRPGLVVEVGIGTGAVAAGLRERGFPVCGVDLSAPMVARARQRLGGVVGLGDAQALPLRSGCADNVVFAHVLHLVGDMARALSEATRVLRPGGRLVATHGNLRADPDDVIETIAPLDALQQRPDSPEDLAAAGRAAGLRVAEQVSVGGYARDTSPNEFADSIETKSWPYLWRVDDRTWAGTVQPVLAALRRLPDPDRRRHQVWRVHLTVLDKA